ncbi:MAG: ankyrin repeat domain-containing protein [Maribacter sp.]|uniref:ankyrin repeat domain-containing protein n=1 Tax=Maribacter sp. TaxID=1897614 RepID=UPI003299174F
MKKTILTAVAFCMLMVTVAVAKTETSNDNTVVTELIVKKELSTFCKAIMQGDIDTVKRLIDLGEDVNAKSLGMTPAIFAARYNKAEILEVLIDNGADLNLKCNKGWTIEKYAKLSNAKDVLEVLKNNV